MIHRQTLLRGALLGFVLGLLSSQASAFWDFGDWFGDDDDDDWRYHPGYGYGGPYGYYPPHYGYPGPYGYGYGSPYGGSYGNPYGWGYGQPAYPPSGNRGSTSNQPAPLPVPE